MRFLLPLLILTATLGSNAFAQPQTADKIVAVIGRNRIILNSELETQVAQMLYQDSTANSDTLRCSVLQQLIMQKMLVEQAERDSLIVSDDEVESTLDNRIRYFIRQYGSRENMETAIGKTVYQLKDDYKDITRESLMAERMQDKILQNIRITPGEVQAFFKRQDSLPLLPATVEVGQIVMNPVASPEAEAYARQKIENIRHMIVDSGANFENMVAINSDDPGSRDNGGRYDGITRDGGWAPEFVAAAFRLQNGEISPVIKTQFGYHIIQMIERKGDEVNIRHILVRPLTTSFDYQASMNRLDSVRSMIIAGKISFAEAVGKYSTDEATKMTGGMITSPQTGASQLEIDQLDPTLALMMDSLQVNTYSQPHFFTSATGERSARFVWLKSKTPPHRANLTDDYNRIQTVALTEKKNKKLEAWLADRLPSYYIHIAPEYQGCHVLKPWVDRMAGQ